MVAKLTDALDCDALVDAVVARANEGWLEPKSKWYVPDDLATGLDEYGDLTWQIRAGETAPWIAPFLAQAPCPFPLAFCSLITRYRFCEFDLGPVTLFANVGDEGDRELAVRTVGPKGWAPLLRDAGFLEFGQPMEGSFDAVCFDMRGRFAASGGIVRLDHEQILMYDRIRLESVLATSFDALLKELLREA